MELFNEMNKNAKIISNIIMKYIVCFCVLCFLSILRPYYYVWGQ